MNNKPNQHYVWQHYLKSWTCDDQLFCLRNHKKIFQTSTRNVASQRFFYGVDGLTTTDCAIIRKAFIDKTKGYTKEILSRWMYPIETGISIRDILKSNGHDDAVDEINVYLKNMIEEVYAEIEQGAIPGLNKLLTKDTSFFLSEDEDDTIGVDFIAFLCYQYFRTKRMKESVVQNLGLASSLFSDLGKAFNLIALLLATQLGSSICKLIEERNYFCCLLSNNTSVPFIAGDQPVINTLANNNPSVETTDLELYFPLSPNLALLVSNRISCDIECGENEALRYNSLISAQSLESVFSVKEDILYRYLDQGTPE